LIIYLATLHISRHIWKRKSWTIILGLFCAVLKFQPKMKNWVYRQWWIPKLHKCHYKRCYILTGSKLSIPNFFIKQFMQCDLPHINEIVEEFVGRYNNIFVMEVRQVFSNIWVFKDWCFANAHWQRGHCCLNFVFITHRGGGGGDLAVRSLWLYQASTQMISLFLNVFIFTGLMFNFLSILFI
jgi:hypothetical protein